MAMRQVDLDGPETDDEVAPGSAPRRRRARWWAAGVVGLVVCGLVGGQWVVDRREDAAVARLLALPGVVAPIGGSLVARPASDAEIGALWGVRASVELNGSGAQSVTWQADGGSAWTAELLGPVSALAVDGANSSSSCQSDAGSDDSARFVVCDVSDGGWVDTMETDGGFLEIPATRGEVMVLDAADGAVVERWSVPAGAGIAIIDDVVAVGALEDGDEVVTGYETATGSRLWTNRAPAVARPADDGSSYGVSVGRVGPFVVAQGTSAAVRLLRADGTEVAEVSSADGEQDGGYVYCQEAVVADALCTASDARGQETVTVIADDVVTLSGSLVHATVDDGSVPGLVLTRDGTLKAWDASSGRALWSLESVSGYDAAEAIVARGLVYVVSSGTLVAIDGRTGAIRWRGANEAGEVATGLLTDGRHVVATYETGGDDAFLVAFDARSGERLFRAEYPAPVRRLAVGGKRLVGYADQEGITQDYYFVD